MTAGTICAPDLPRLTESEDWVLTHQNELKQDAADERAGLPEDLKRAESLLNQTPGSRHPAR